MLAADESLD